MFKRIVPFIEIMRPSVVTLAGLFTLLGNLLSGGFSPFSIISAMLLCGAGNVINDIIDYEIDKINRPNRPLPSGKITIDQAKSFYIFLTIIGLIFTLVVNLEFFFVGVLSVFLSYIYAKKLKKQPYIGNIVVSILSILTIFAGMVAIGKINILGIYLILTALFGSIAREIIKDIEDIKGDKEKGAKTIPIVYGTKFAKFLAIINITIAALFALKISIVLCLLYITSIFIVLFFNSSISQRYMKILMLITVLFIFFLII